jgi:hypothetical protein
LIDLGRPALHAEGVTVFYDHADPARFHYLPDRPQLRLEPDGTPELSLLEYELGSDLTGILGAGLLSLTVALDVDPDVLSRLRSRLAAQAGVSAITLGAVAADSGSCELILIDRSSAAAPADGGGQPAPGPALGLVERILGAAAPSLYGDNAAMFAAVLSPEGVGLVEKALRQGGLPAGVVYTLQVTGLRPALRATITARWQDAYDFYENRLHGGKLLLAVDVGTTVEQLVHDEVIRVSVDDLVPDAEHAAVYQHALDQAQQYVLDTLFKPSLGQQPPPEDSGSGPLAAIGTAIKDIAGFFSLTYSLRQVDRSELKTFTYRLAAAEAEHLTLAPQGTFSILFGPGGIPGGVDRLITKVTGGPPSEMRFDVGVLTDLGAQDIDHLEVTLRYGESAQTLVLDADTPSQAASVWYRPEVGLAVTYTYEVHFAKATAGLGGVLTSPEQTSDHRVIRLDPAELYQRLQVRAVAEGLPFDRYPSVLVDLRAQDPVAGWTAEDTLELGAAQPEATFPIRAALDAKLRIQRRLRYVEAQGQEYTVDWDEAEPGVLVVGDPLPDVVDVQVLGSARFGTELSRIVVELRPTSAPSEVATRVLSSAQPSATWSWAVPAGGDRTYEYRVTLQTALNEVRTGAWLPGPDGGTLVVGEGIARLRTVQLILVGKSFHDLGLMALKVKFSFEDAQAGLSEEKEFLVQDPRTQVEWSYPVADPSRETYTCQLTYIHDDGRVDPQPPTTSSDLMLVEQLA